MKTDLVAEPVAAKGYASGDIPLLGNQGETPVPAAEVSLRGQKSKPPRPVSMPPSKLAVLEQPVVEVLCYYWPGSPGNK